MKYMTLHNIVMNTSNVGKIEITKAAWYVQCTQILNKLKLYIIDVNSGLTRVLSEAGHSLPSAGSISPPAC